MRKIGHFSPTVEAGGNDAEAAKGEGILTGNVSFKIEAIGAIDQHLPGFHDSADIAHYCVDGRPARCNAGGIWNVDTIQHVGVDVEIERIDLGGQLVHRLLPRLGVFKDIRLQPTNVEVTDDVERPVVVYGG